MLEFILDIFVSGVFELVAELVSPAFRGSPPERRKRLALTAKLALGVACGGGWGYFVGRSSEVAWPLTFWSFAAIGAVALLMRIADVSNARATSDISNSWLRTMVTFDRDRFTGLVGLSAAAAFGVAVGFLLAG